MAPKTTVFTPRPFRGRVCQALTNKSDQQRNTEVPPVSYPARRPGWPDLPRRAQMFIRQKGSNSDTGVIIIDGTKGLFFKSINV